MLRQFYIFSYKKHGHRVGIGRFAKYNYLCHSELSDSVIQIPRLKCDYIDVNSWKVDLLMQLNF